MAVPEPPIYPDLRNKVVLITGIGQQGDREMWGNGAATAQVFAQQGAKVFGCDLKVESARYTQAKIRAGGVGEMEVMEEAVDVTKKEQCRRFVEACVERFGRVDVLVK